MKTDRSTGIKAALSSAFLMGLAPVFGRQAILFGLSPLFVVTVRTVLAAALLFLIVALFRRAYLFIYPAGMLGCTLAGVVNGLGSICYYLALGRLSASIGQMLYALYPLFLALWLLLDKHPLHRLTLGRIALAALAVLLLTGGSAGGVDPTGVALMIAGSVLYALHIPINQRVLYDVPSPTVTLYTLLAISAVVIPAFLLSGSGLPVPGVDWRPVIGLTLVTVLSRLALFLGVKHLGGMETALLGLSELLVAIVFGHWWLGERLTEIKWLGAFLLAASLLLVVMEPGPPAHTRRASGWLNWIRP